MHWPHTTVLPSDDIATLQCITLHVVSSVKSPDIMIMMMMTMMASWSWDDDGLEGVCRLGPQVLGPGPGCSCGCLWPDSRVSGKYDAKLSTERREERESLRPHHDGWSPGPRWQGSEKTIQRPWESRVTNYFYSYGKLFYTATSELLWWIRAFTWWSTKCCVTQEITTSGPGLNT